jgi:DNA-binding IclR family transcriptional regulator
VAAISVSGPRIRLEDDRLAELAKHVVVAARSISTYSNLEES